MMNNKYSIKLTLLASVMASIMGLTACQKQTEEPPAPEVEAEVPMSAEPAEGNDPVIVADDLEDVDARSAGMENTEAENAESANAGEQGQHAEQTIEQEPVSQEPEVTDQPLAQ